MEMNSNYSSTFIIENPIMLRISFIALAALLFTNSNCTAQANQAEFQASLVGNIHYAIKSSVKPINEFGINYQPYLFPRTYLVLGLQGNARNYKEISTDTANLYKGNLKYGQWIASIGVRHLFREEVIETVNYFAEASFHYTRLKTEGEYTDGQFGTAYYRYNRFKGVGLGFKTGVIYQFNSPWYLGANMALYFSGGKSGEQENYTITPDPAPVIEEFPFNNSFTNFGLEIRVGYRFYK